MNGNMDSHLLDCLLCAKDGLSIVDCSKHNFCVRKKLCNILYEIFTIPWPKVLSLTPQKQECGIIGSCIVKNGIHITGIFYFEKYEKKCYIIKLIYEHGFFQFKEITFL